MSVDPLPTMTIESEVLARWPLTRSVEATVPEIGAVRVAAARFAFAAVTTASELITVTLSSATRAAAEVADPADDEPPEVELPDADQHPASLGSGTHSHRRPSLRRDDQGLVSQPMR